MPKKTIDYANTVIYKIVCNDLNITQCYVGHTTDLVRRRQHHKKACIYEKGPEYNTKKYKIIRDEGGFENWNMILIEKYPCLDVYEAKKKEREWYEKLNSKLNTLSPQRTLTNQEYYIANREHIIKQVQIYAANHKKEIAEHGRLHRISHKEENSTRRSKRITCECGLDINLDHKSRHLKTKLHNNNLKTINENLLGKEDNLIT
jgi:hypothetical protein